MNYNKRCKCGKVSYLSEGEVCKEVIAQKALGRMMSWYMCKVHRGHWHITTDSSIKRTQLVMGELTKYHTLILVLPLGFSFFLVRPEKKVSKSLHDVINNIIQTDDPCKELGRYYPIACKQPFSQWVSHEPWVAQNINRSDHFKIDVASQVTQALNSFRNGEVKKKCVEITALLEAYYFRLKQEDIRALCKLSPAEVVHERVQEDPPVIVEEPVVVHKEKKPRRERRFVTLTEPGILAWDTISKFLMEGETIHTIVEGLLIEESTRRSN